jgi:glycosyltransferase involved in cell wall biosynthesis
MRVVLVAAPLMARSGVYRSALDLVAAARSAGHDWHAVLGVRPEAAGTPSDDPNVIERPIAEHGTGVLDAVDRLVRDSGLLTTADAVVSMIPQSDMVLARHPEFFRRIAWVRGLPWPAAGEQHPVRRALLTTLERRALRHMDDVWSTTPLLEAQLGRSGRGHVVPAGVRPLDAVAAVRHDGPLVFAGRLSGEKGADRFLGIAARTGLDARIHGTGALEAELRRASPANLEWGGWRAADEIWADAGVCLVPSLRDAFGRTPVEAATAGVPVVLSDQVGAAELLYTDPALRAHFVLPVDDAAAWDRAVTDLRREPDLHAEAAEHVARNARELTVDASVRAAIAALAN